MDQGTEAKVMASGFVRVEVGPEEKTYLLYRSLLQRDSGFFRTALAMPSAAKPLQVVKLPEETAVDFDIFVEFIHGKRWSDFSVNGEAEGYDDTTFEKLIRQWLMAERLEALGLQNELIEVMVACNGYRCAEPKPEDINIIYQTTAPTSALRRFFIDLYTLCGPYFTRENVEQYPTPFLHDVILNHGEHGGGLARYGDQVYHLDANDYSLWERSGPDRLD